MGRGKGHEEYNGFLSLTDELPLNPVNFASPTLSFFGSPLDVRRRQLLPDSAHC